MMELDDLRRLCTPAPAASAPDKAPGVPCERRAELLSVSHQFGVLAALTEPLRDFVEAAKALSARKAYRRDWGEFVGFCDGQGVDALPCALQTLASYLTALAQRGRKGAGHSLRAGLVTTAAGAGNAEHSIMPHTGHVSAETVHNYIRTLRLFEDNAAMGTGL